MLLLTRGALTLIGVAWQLSIFEEASSTTGTRASAWSTARRRTSVPAEGVSPSMSTPIGSLERSGLTAPAGTQNSCLRTELYGGWPCYR
jgi:hypothetical protein